VRTHLRLRRSPAAFWLVAVVIAALTGTVVSRLVERASAAVARYGSPSTVVVARHEVAAGERVERGDVERRALPASFVPPGALRSPPVGRVVVVALLPGQVVVARQLSPAGLSPVAALVPDGRKAVAVPTGGLAPPLRRGDVVDVLVTVDDGADPPTFPVAEGAPVVHVNEDAVTVAVDERDVARVAFAAAKGVVTLVLSAERGGE
jgi:Flp pilus assembly protein CpaB